MAAVAVLLLSVACGGSEAPVHEQPTLRDTAQSDTRSDTLRAASQLADPDDQDPAASQTDAQPSENSRSLTQAERRLAKLLEPADITLDGSVARYTGALNEASVSRFLSLVEEHDVEINTLVINARGGPIHVGQRLGLWVHERQLTLVVEGICLSSCANYVFTAAPRKIIRANAVVAWHGSAQQWSLIEAAEDAGGEEYDDDFRNSVFAASEPADEVTTTVLVRKLNYSPEDKEKLARAGLSLHVIIRTSEAPPDQAWLEVAIQQEQAFLDRIGVPADALLWGLMPERIEAYRASGSNYWTFSIDDMRKLGIEHVVYAGQGSYPSDEALSRQAVMLFEVDATSG